MGEQQPLRVGPPKANDTGLTDFSSMLQKDFEVLFDIAHEHRIKTAKPGSRDGKSGDLVIVDDGTNVYLVLKTSRGWFKSAAFSAL